MSYIYVVKTLAEVEDKLEETLFCEAEKISFTNKEGEIIELCTKDVERGIKKSKEIKVLASQLANKLLILQNKEGIIKTEEFLPFLDMMTKYHIKVIERSYNLEHSSMEHCHKLSIERDINELLCSQYCSANIKSIHRYAEENGISIP